MRRVALVVMWMLLSTAVSAQSPTRSPSRSVWLDAHTPADLAAAIASGKTTLIYSGGSSLAVANHVEVARYVARRVAEELGNALVLPIVPDPTAGARSTAGSQADSAYNVIAKAISSAAFKYVFVIGDEGTGPGDTTLETLAKRLNTDFESKGMQAFYVTAHETRPGQQGLTFNGDYLRRWAARTVPAERRKPVEDAAELLYVDPSHKFLNPATIAASDRGVVKPALGRILLEERVTSILNQVRTLSPSHLRPPSSVGNPRNRLTAIPEDKVTEPLRSALADYRDVRPDGLGGDRGGAVGNGGPSLWSVYVHLPEILGPIRALHEQAHVNPRISQKLVHLVILINARYWTNDIWSAHDEDVIKEGLGADTVKALAEGRHPDHMAEDESIIYDFCTELLENRRVSDATYARAVAKFGEEGVVQTAVIQGLYSYMSMAVNMAYPESADHGRLLPFVQ
jgi:4-carboxymuconolactone decarboxylase